MKAIKKISFWSVAVLVVMGFSLPSMAATVTSYMEDFEDGDSNGWREHRSNTPDQDMFTVVAGAGKNGSFGYQRTGPDASRHAEAIFSQIFDNGWVQVGQVLSPVAGEVHVLTGDLKMSVVPGNSRTGLSWGYYDNGWPVPHYQISVQNGSGGLHIELQKIAVDNSVNLGVAGGSGPTIDSAYFLNNWVNLEGRFEKQINGDLQITVLLDGVEQFTALDTTPLPQFNGWYYAGVYTGFNSVDSVVFDNIGLNVVPVPEPASLGLLALGAGLMLVRRTKK